MGIDYTLVCDGRREYIKPMKIDGEGSRLAPLTRRNVDIGRLTIYAMTTFWSEDLCRFASEWYPSDYPTYTDVTKNLVDDFNKFRSYYDPSDVVKMDPREMLYEQLRKR